MNIKLTRKCDGQKIDVEVEKITSLQNEENGSRIELGMTYSFKESCEKVLSKIRNYDHDDCDENEDIGEEDISEILEKGNNIKLFVIDFNGIHLTFNKGFSLSKDGDNDWYIYTHGSNFKGLVGVIKEEDIKILLGIMNNIQFMG